MARLTFSINFNEVSGFLQYYVVIICAFFFLVSSILIPGISSQNLPMNQCVTGYNADNDYFPDKATVETATLFSINYFKSYKLVTNKQTNEIFALYQCGTPIPANLPAGAKPIQISVKNVAVTDTSAIPFLDLLGFRSSIKLLDTSDLVSSPCVQSAKDSGTISILTNNQTLNTIELAGVDVSFGAFQANPADPKSVSIAAASDPGIINRVEWLKFYSTFFNAEAKANDVYGKIKANYECYKNLANKNAPSAKPIVAWVNYDAPSEFNQNTPSWQIADAAFKKQLTEDAGGAYFNVTPLSYATSADFLKAIQNVDIIIDETFVGSNIADFYSNFGITPDQQQQFKFVKNQAIYREDGTTNPNDGRDWLENAIAMGDALLEDMINVVNPKLPKSDYNRIWLRNIAKNEPIKISSAANCTNPDQSLTSKADDCAAVSAKGTGAISSTPTFFSCFIAIIFVTFVTLFI
ncbi:hypothetical protein RclHR1_00570009 [Rhizophagus clarus]|uniref:Fe/B12 periplasmic-binding domain-containing protein n=1 Tax=Rhizophagus clarus TaxID=94130 RepID=A0A2Z6RUF7_9GLOM|nr:hypothetical protein RclHR1_00570009 [Rhizophagus clarus]